MTTNEQEALEFSMLYGSVGESQTNEEGREIVFDLPRYFECVAAIREKDAKLIEMLKNSVKRVLISFGSENDCPAIGYIEPMALDFVGTGSISAGERAEKDFYRTVIQPCEHALSATKATSDAFIAEIEAGVLKELHRRYHEANGHLSLAVISTSMLDERNSFIIEKRKQAEQLTNKEKEA